MITAFKFFQICNDTYSFLNRYDTDGVKALPCITFCAFDSFKYNGIYFDEESYLNSTFGLNEIFDELMVASLSNISEYFMVESKTLLAGRCYTACHQVSVL
jgi:hypothetical protein